MATKTSVCAYCGAERHTIQGQVPPLCMLCASPSHYVEVIDYEAAHKGEEDAPPFYEWRAGQAAEAAPEYAP